jgi:LDH2 family malate/lactate/ureidoglycolate dehydrogenase
MTEVITIRAEALLRWTIKVLELSGASHSAAAATAESLVDANRRGLDSHGVIQLHFYLPGLKAGTTSGDAEPTVEADLPAAAVVDGHHALGPYVAQFAMDLCCSKARSVGAAVVGVRNSTHFGAASCVSEQAARQNCIGIVVSNSDPGMSPPGALGPVLGTNPLAVAAPSQRGRPVSFDIATSVVAHGKVVLAAREGRAIPSGWAIGPDGRPTTDPTSALAGAMLPMAGHKGFGLAVMIDILAGCLTGSALSPEISNDPAHPAQQRTGHLLIAIAVDRFVTAEQYSSALERLAHTVHTAPRAPGTGRFLLPGELEASAAQQRAAEGIPLDSASVSLLAEIGATHCVPFPP